MPQDLGYCDVCGKLITPSEARSGRAVLTPDLSACAACAEGLDAKRRTAPGSRARETSAGPAAAQSGRRVRGTRSPGGPSPRTRRSAREAAPGSGSRAKVLAAAAVGAGVLAGVAVVLLMAGPSAPDGVPPRPARKGGASTPSKTPVTPTAPTAPTRPGTPATSAATSASTKHAPPARSDAPPPRPPAAGVVPPAAPSAGPAPVRKRIADLRGLIDPELSRRDEISRRAEKLLSEIGGRPEAEEVRKLVSEVDARYAKVAQEALEAAAEAAEGLVAQGKFEDAARAFGYVRMRFGKGEWFREKGEARIKPVLERVEEARAAYEKSGLSLRDDFSGYAEGSDGSPRWASKGAGVKGGRLVFETGGRAHLDVRQGRTLTAQATVVPKRRTRGEWTACGLVAWKSGGEYWETGLAEGPDGKRYLWLYETYAGAWHRLHKPSDWQYGTTYTVSLELTPDGVTGRVEGPGGAKLGRIGKKFDEKRRASAVCRPGVFANGCEAAFDDVSAVVRDAAGAASAVASRGDAPAKGPATPAGKTAPAREPSRPDEAPAVTAKATAAAVELPGGPKEPLPGETGLPGQWAPGLIAEVFAGHDMTKRIGVRIDRQMSFNFGPAPADLGAPPDNFAVRWTGWLLVPRDGAYVFEAEGDDRLSVALDGKPLVSGGYGDGKGRSPARFCEAGLHPISAVYTEVGGNAFAHLRWQPRGEAMRAIPSEYFFHEVPEPGKMGPFAKVVEGLWGEYYKGESFNQKLGDGPVVHPAKDYGDLPAYAGGPKDNFSVRMKGYILLYWKGTYRFDVDIDDGVRLKVDGATVIDHWGKPSSQRVSGKKEFDAGYHEVVVEHMERGGGAKIYFWWVPPAYGDVNNPTTYYMPKRIWFHKPSRKDTADRKGLAPGMKGKFYGRAVPGGKVLLESLDPAAHFSWEGSPGAGVPADRFSGSWEGTLVVPRTGVYVFGVRRRGGVELAIARRAVIRNWEDAEGWLDASLPLRAGKLPITLRYSNVQGKAEAKVYWSGPGFGLRALGSEAVAHRAAALPVAKAWEEKTGKVAATPVRTGASGKARRLVAGNQIRNGGFEETSERTKFASRWTRGQWGAKGAQYYVKMDRSNPHAGDRALAVKALAEGALPGAFATLDLPMGEYEVRYWACADVEARARVQASLAGRELAANVVGEEWKQFREKVDLGEDEPRASLRLWTSTLRVRVWFDDVEVVPAWRKEEVEGK